jgi:ABC-type tungstate transport system permease subunit
MNIIKNSQEIDNAFGTVLEEKASFLTHGGVYGTHFEDRGKCYR